MLAHMPRFASLLLLPLRASVPALADDVIDKVRSRAGPGR
jgi:hypothetical protein